VVWLLRCSVLRGTPMPGTGDCDFQRAAKVLRMMED
jgi:hypothetical protein